MSNTSEPERPQRGNAWVTLATNDTYALGALVLARSLNKAATKYAKCVMITDSVSQSMKSLLEEVFDSVVTVNLLDSADSFHLAMLARPELGVTFTKVHCWLRIEYGKCVFLDADTLVLENCDELFEREELSAAPDVGWPDCFNSGVFVFRPNADTFASLVSFALHTQSFDGGDQGLLNLFFKNWALEGPDKRLPFIYNMCSTACYSYIPAFKMFGGAAKIVHFIGPRKPWMFEINPLSGKVNPAEFSHLSEYLQNWWDLCIDTVLPQLTTQMAGLPAVLSALSIGGTAGGGLEEHWRRTAWESSTADYMGRDSFDNVWEKIQATLEGPGEVAPGAELPSDASGKAEEPTGGKSPAFSDSEKPVRAEAPAEDPKGALPAATAALPAVATPPLPSALVDVDSSSASNLGSLAQTVSQAVAPSLSSLELSLPPVGLEHDALTVDRVVTGQPSVALDTLAGDLISAVVAPSPIPVDSGLPELSAETYTSKPVIPVPALSDSILPELPAVLHTTEQPEIPIKDATDSKPSAESLTTEQPAIPITEATDSKPSAESLTTEQPAIPITAATDSIPPAELLSAIPITAATDSIPPAESLSAIPISEATDSKLSAESLTTEQPAIPIPVLPESVLPELPAETLVTEPLVPNLEASDPMLPEPSVESHNTEQPAVPIPAPADSGLPGLLATESAIPNVPNDPSAAPAKEAEGEGPSVTGDPRLEPGPVPSAPRPPQPVPRTPTVIEATPPTSPPIGQAGVFPLAPPAPALVGAALAKERPDTAPASQNSEPEKFDQ